MKRGIFQKGLILLIVITLFLAVGCSNQQKTSENNGSDNKQAQEKDSASKSNYPSKPITFIVPANPGGGWDLTARAMQKVLKEENLVEQEIKILNKPGGNAEPAWQYLKNQDSHTISINSALILNNVILGRSELTYKDFTPLATISSGWEALVVPVNSPYKTAQEFMEQLAKDPESLKMGLFSIGNNAHLTFIQAAKQFNVDPSKITFLVDKSGANIVTQLAGNHLDGATMYAAEARELAEAGKVRILAVATEERMADFPDVPTWKEMGGISLGNWRGFMGPPNMTEEEIAYWDEVFEKMAKTKAWQDILEKNQWSDYYKDSKETIKLLDNDNEIYADLIKAAGLLK